MDLNSFIEEYQKHNPGDNFFYPETLRWFGERKSEMRVLKDHAIIRDYDGEFHECYVVSALQRNNPIRPTRKYFYFDAKTFHRIFND